MMERTLKQHIDHYKDYSMEILKIRRNALKNIIKNYQVELKAVDNMIIAKGDK